MKNKIVVILLSILSFLACTNDDGVGPSRIDTSTPELSETDVWIREQFTTPYNISVDYLFNDNEVNVNRYLTPPKHEEVIPFLQAFLDVMLNPFKDYKDADFVKRYFPKLLVLVGSYNYNNDGTRRLGQAEGGKKVTLFEINFFTERISNEDNPEEARRRFKRYFHTVQHEFGHILQQTKVYDKESFRVITPFYRSSWNNLNDQEAFDLGYITPYSALNEDEDFVEILATMLTNSPEEFEEILDRPSTDAAKAALRAKLQIIVNYYKDSWGIDLYELQLDIAEKMDAYF